LSVVAPGGLPGGYEQQKPPGSPDIRVRKISVGPTGDPTQPMRSSSIPNIHTSYPRGWTYKADHAPPDKPPLKRIDTQNLDVTSSKVLVILLVVVGIIISVVVLSYVLKSMWKK
jgi:hypothetical protein